MKKDIRDNDDKNEILDNIIKEQGLVESLKERMDLSEYGECPVCGETLYELKVRPKIEPDQKTLEGEDAVEPKVLKRCHICGDPECQYYDEDGYAVHPEYIGEKFGDGDWMCYNCRERPIGGVTLINESGTRHFTAYGPLLTDDEEGNGDISEEESAALEDLAKSIHYVRSDAWRGYYDSKAPKGWKCLATGWHSTVEDSKMSDYIVSLGYKNKKAFPIIRVVLQTSNCCSAAVDVYVPKDADTSELEADMPPQHAENYNIGPPEGRELMSDFGYHVMNKCPSCGNRRGNGIDELNSDGTPHRAICNECGMRFVLKMPMVGLFTIGPGGRRLVGIVDYVTKEILTVDDPFVTFRKIDEVEKELREMK